jgi:hypothetical protein
MASDSQLPDQVTDKRGRGLSPPRVWCVRSVYEGHDTAYRVRRPDDAADSRANQQCHHWPCQESNYPGQEQRHEGTAQSWPPDGGESAAHKTPRVMSRGSVAQSGRLWDIEASYDVSFVTKSRRCTSSEKSCMRMTLRAATS